MNIPPLLKLALIACFFTLNYPSHAQELDALKENTDRWIEVRSRLSKEKSEWDVEQQVLKNGIETLKSSKAALETNVVFHETENDDLNAKLQEAEKRLGGFEATDELLLSHVIQYEARVLELAKRLPSPLLDDLQQLLAKVPTDTATETPLPNRLQNLVAIMTIIDEFNNALRLSHTITELDNGEIIEVRILYWGLATGYATNSVGSRAWVLKPGNDGWTWIPADDNTVAIKQLFDVYDKIVDPAIVGVPFSFLGKEASQ